MVFLPLTLLAASACLLIPKGTSGLNVFEEFYHAWTGVICREDAINSEIACLHQKSCMPTAGMCDGKDDCGDGSDETEGVCHRVHILICPKFQRYSPQFTTNSSQFQTDSSHFQCKNYATISSSLVCDGKEDCLDGSDELECKRCFCKTAKNSPYFQCKYGACIDKDQRCDGRKDCYDGSDEQDCTNKGGISPTTSTSPTTMATTENSCRVPPHPEHGRNELVCSRGLCQVLSGSAVDHGSELAVECSNKHQLAEGDGSSVCKDGTWEPPSHSCIECGVSNKQFDDEEVVVTLIRNGDDADQGEFPWVAALYLKKSERWEQVCGGTLISPHIVLTAAHCVTSKAAVPLHHSDIHVGLGKLYRDFYHDETSGHMIAVRKVVVPQRYQGSAQYYDLDIALLDLSTSVRSSPSIKPACLDMNNRIQLSNNTIGYVAGWGITEDDRPSALLQWTSQRFIEYETCVHQVGGTNKRLITHDKFCMANPKSASADQGDSGGGLTFIQNGAHFVKGIVSTRQPGVKGSVVFFTDLADERHRSWLRTEQRKLAQEHK